MKTLGSILFYGPLYALAGFIMLVLAILAYRGHWDAFVVVGIIPAMVLGRRMMRTA